MKYLVKRIDEDIDVGCEGRVDGAPVMAVVTLEEICEADAEGSEANAERREADADGSEANAERRQAHNDRNNFSENIEKMVVKQPDQMLYDRNINEGDQVIFDEDRLLKRV